MERTLKTRVISWLLVIVMAVGLLPASIIADELETTTPETVTVAFDVNGGIGEYTSQVVAYNDVVAKPEENPTHDTAVFAYWTADLATMVAWNFETDLAVQDLTLYAVWTNPEDSLAAVSETEEEPEETPVLDEELVIEEAAAPEFTVTFNANGGQGTMDAFVTSTGYLPANVFTRKDFQFMGWNTEAKGTGISYADGAQITLTADVTMYAQWKDVYYSVISEKNWDIAPGIKETELVLNNSTSDHRQVLHIMEADMNNPYTKVTTSYTNMDTSNYAVSNMLVQANWVRDNWGWNVVGAMNSCLSWYNSAAYAEDPSRVNEPLGFMMIDSEVYFDHSVGFPTVLIIHKDTNDAGEPRPADIPKVEMRNVNTSADLNGWEDQVIPVSSGFIVKDGVNTQAVSHTAGAPRSVVGIKPDGTVVIMMNDGRQDPYSIGMQTYELAEVMISLGCSYAVNCDGGGSSTFLSQRPGTTGLAINCSPSDGALRENTSGVLIISTAPATGEFDKAYISSDYDYYVPGSTVEMDVSGLDFSGAAAEIPAEAIWTLSDETFGTVENGVFTIAEKTGTVDVQMIYNDKIVGSKTLNIVNPDHIAFEQASTVIPYGKTISLKMTATYGVFDVGYTDDSFIWSLSDENAGVRDGLSFTATTDASVSGVVVTAAYKYADIPDCVLTISFGLGSQVMWDFEDGDVSNWMGQEQVRQWLAENGIPESGLFPGGNYSEDNSTRTFLSSRTNGGQVKNGAYALGLEVDYRYSRFSEWSYTVLFNVEGETVLRDVENGKNATKLGMWVYIPEGLVVGKDLKGLAMQYQLYGGTATADKKASENITSFGGHLLTANGKNLASLTDADIPEDRWVYFYIDLSSKDYVSLQDPMKQTWREPSFIRFYTQHYTPKNMVFYFDDLTLDYSDAVDDRDAPVISNTTVNIVGNNRRSFNATVADFAASNTSGLNYSTGKIYVDGVELPGVTVAGSTISSPEVDLPAGAHKVTFEITDNMGNTAKKSESFTIAGTAPVVLAGHNDLNNVLEYDSVYYVDINVAAIEKIESIDVVLDLNTAHLWEIEGMVAAEGFTATAAVNQYANTVTVNITKTGDCSLTGAQTLVSIPTRVYSWRDTSVYSKDEIFALGLCPVVPYDAKVVSGKVSFVNGAYDGYFGSFGGSISAATNLDDNKIEWHTHTVTELEDKAASCGESGYIGRTYCHECGSVIDWGTAVAATGHTYDFGEDGLLKCSCGALFNGVYTDGKEYENGAVVADGWTGDSYRKDGMLLTGVQKVPAPDSADEFYYDFGENGVCQGKVKYTGIFNDGELYRYSYLGVLSSGWYMVNDVWHYFSSSTMAAATGHVLVNGVYFDFEEDGKLVSGVWVNAFNGYRYYYGPNYYIKEWVEIDGNWYYFKDGLRLTGYQKVKNRGDVIHYSWHEFGEDGIFKGKLNGIHQINGRYCYFENGIGTKKCLFELDGNYYFADADGYLITNQRFYAYATNCDLPVETYVFDETGKMIGAASEGAIVDMGGTLYYYENGRPTAAGLIQIGEDYYFADVGGKIATGKAYVWRTNGLLPERTYAFDAEGKMIGTNPEGVIIEENGALYYYKTGVATGAGLIEMDGYYYYAGANGLIGTGAQSVAKGNGLLPNGTYYFSADGKMLGIRIVDGTVVEGEIVNGVYYASGRPTAAGLIEYNGYFYFADVNGKIATGKAYIWKTNDLLGLAMDTYAFSADGKLYGVKVVDGQIVSGEIVETDNGLYYYVNGKANAAGLIELNGAYYFVDIGGKVATGKYYVWKTNDLLPMDNYYFDENGRMLGVAVEDDTVVEGEIVLVNGVRYYYENGKPTPAGLVEVDGNYYFVDVGGLVVTGRSYVWRGNGILPEDTYQFAEDGRLLGMRYENGEVVTGEIVEINDGLYYYISGKAETAGLIVIDGNYYFVDVKGKVVTGKSYVWRTNGLLPEENYYFDATGRMYGIKDVGDQTVIGEIVDFDGTLTYFENGRPTPAGLVEVDGYFYFADVNGVVATGKSYVWRPNGILPKDTYQFHEDGRMMGVKVVDGNIVTGEIVTTSGKMYYYSNGKAETAGLIEMDGYYYFVDIKGEVATGRSYVWMPNGIIPAQTCYFDETGKMAGLKIVDGQTIVGEIIEINGVRYYYENGAGVRKGIVYLDGYYYFADVDGKLVTDRRFYVWKGNGLLVQESYNFDALGRITG